MAESKQYRGGEPTAIIGSACRFPGGSNSPSRLWDLLREPRDVLKEFDPDRLNLWRFYHADGSTHGSTDVANKSYLLEEDSRVFDTSFFGISPVEAAGMDPQQRVLLETTYEAFESAGLSLDQLRGSLTSVHVGVMTNDWSAIQQRDIETMPTYAATGMANSIISNRISYVFDLKGPSETIDTACSSSLVALHHATRALLNGDCETAVVAGVNLILDASVYIAESKLHMLSSDARSRMWDKSANGYARGEGAAALVLKPLGRALSDGDHIEGLVRSTGVNSDGRGPGITMPSATAQAALIRQTYRRAGLDPIKDRPQYFEAHGTGTPAGDPIEAHAISKALVRDQSVYSGPDNDHPIYVGSIKTVIGHLEGCAGLAGVIKVLLAIKHRIIPPNLLFEELNPAIAPYYGPLRIPTEALPWPELQAGTPARASVNSFGFGGTNAHVIIESFDDGDSKILEQECSNGDNDDILGPLVFSAASRPSLLRTVRNYLKHLRQHPQLRLRDVSWLLHSRRSTHRIRAHFSGVSRDAILESMEGFVAKHEHDNEASATSIIYQLPQLTPNSHAPRILGIFTGQGAQWPRMARELMDKSPLFRKTIEECESVLQALPACDAPEWSLVQELEADSSSSRASEAAISQPLCTAVQLGLVRLLRAAGIRFAAVVGHSSGEIAATYATGFTTLKGAMQIAYYRGFHAKLAMGPKSQLGSMLAAGLSLAEASHFCSRAGLTGRITVAASNGPQSVTLSGDLEAIREAKQQLEADNVFARLLKVDTAYHSHHMQPCAVPFLKSLAACDIEVRQPESDIVWSSSVYGDTGLGKHDDDAGFGSLKEALKGPYWVANMVQTVLFSQAVEFARRSLGDFDMAIEVGPHPALKGPTEQTLKALGARAVAYAGTLRRNSSDVEAFSAALGATWAQLGPLFLDIKGYHEAFSSSKKYIYKVTKNLPLYSWDHDKIHWCESRISRRFRTGTGDDRRRRFHELLGRRSPDDTHVELRWRNVLKLSELPWIRGHNVLHQVLLPGAAYVSIPIEAGLHLAGLSAVNRDNRPLRLLEVTNVDIYRPVVVSDDQDGVETLFAVHLLDSPQSLGSTTATADLVVRARFSYYVCNDQLAESMIHTCSGDLLVHFGAKGDKLGLEDLLPPRDSLPTNLVPVDPEHVYSMLEDVGLKYSGAFRAMTECNRCLDYAAAAGVWDWNEGDNERSLSDGYLVHPAMLDVAFQTLFVARAHPDTHHMVSALLPSHIDRVLVSPAQITKHPEQSQLGRGRSRADFEAWVVKQTATSLTGDLNVYDAACGKTLLQIEGLDTRMVGGQDASQDRPLFAKTVWAGDVSHGLAEPVRHVAREADLLRLMESCERVALFYVRRLMDEISAQERAESHFSSYHRRMLEAFQDHLDMVRSGQHPVLSSDWLEDEQSMLHEMDAEHPNLVEMEMLHVVGNNVASVVRGEKHMLEVLSKDDLLNRFYLGDTGCMQINRFVAHAMQQISFKFPRCNILEIGAGTGGTTWSVLTGIGDAFNTYTYTDISASFFFNATQRFSDFTHKMVFKALNVEGEPVAQGFMRHSYDVVIAANVLHATRNLKTTMRNVRSLLRPGGYLLLFEITGTYTLRCPFSFGGLPGWWLGEEDERRLRPIVAPFDWDTILCRTGFLGADKVIHDVADESQHTFSLIVSQAVDDAFLRLREPLSIEADVAAPLAEAGAEAEPMMLLVGGRGRSSSNLIREVQRLLPRRWRSRIQKASSIESLTTASLTPGMHVICLQELDGPLFATPMTAQRMTILQCLLMKTKNLLWVTSASNGKSHTPRAGMIHGIARVMPTEMPQLHLQILGIDLEFFELRGARLTVSTARHIVEAFLRLRETAEPDDDGSRSKALWLHEPEVELLANGQVVIPRVLLDTALNDVYFASARAVTKTVNATDITVQAIPGPAKMILQAAGDTTDTVDVNDSKASVCHTARIQVKYALQIPANGGHDAIYLVCGNLQEKCEFKSSVMAISSVNASVVNVEPDHPVAIDLHDCTPDVLAATADRLFVQAITNLATKAQIRPVVLLYGVQEPLASMVATELVEQGGHAYFASASSDAPDSWIKMHAYASRRTVQRLVPAEIGIYVDCSLNNLSAESNTLRVCLPPSCVQRQLDALLLRQVLHETGAGKDAAAQLEDAYSHIKKSSGQGKQQQQQNREYMVIRATELASTDVSLLMHKRYVTDWRNRESLLLTVPPLDVQGLFRPDKTYLMVGASGGLGLSLCQWMIRHGVKNMVVASRNPKADPSMLEGARRTGASVRFVTMDVANKDSVKTIVQLVQDTMPPVAGVCNAAMVLSDGLFFDMDVDQFNKTLAAKVDGSENLDFAFADNQQLDFFVMLSSAATIVGNMGQANYHSANLFMENLVKQRRARGLAASIIHVGWTFDVGYLTRNQSRMLDRQFHQLRLVALSETDVHHAFAQAIRGGRPSKSSGSYNIVMSLRPPAAPVAPDLHTPWLSNPRLGHFVPFRTLQGHQDRREANAAGSGNVRQQVEQAQTQDEGVSAVLAAFCVKLESILQLPTGSVKQQIHRPIIDIGIDSLAAVEIRTWFLKELGAEVHVIRILQGDSVVKVCTSAANEVMAKNKTLVMNEAQNVEAVDRETEKAKLVPASALGGASTSLGIDDATSASKSEAEDSGGSAAMEAEEEGKEASIKPRANVNVIRQGPMSPAQARIWFLSKHFDDPTSFNMVFHYHIHGALSMSRLRHALQVAMQHHECLRMCFYPRIEDGHPMQGVMASCAYELKYVAHADEVEVQEQVARLKRRVWHLESGQTLGVAVLSRRQNSSQSQPEVVEQYEIVFGYHHIVTDALGLHSFLRDLDTAYKMHALDKKAAGSHIEFSARQLELEKSGALEEQLAYWQAEFTSLPETLPLLPMAVVSARPEGQSHNKSHREYRQLDQMQLAAIRDTCRRLRIGPFHFHLAVLQVLLARYTSAEDICVGIVDANRNGAGSAQMVGCFINTLPVRSHVPGHATFADVARAAARKALAAFAHSQVSLEMILDKVKAPRSSEITPLFQVLVNYRTTDIMELPLGECRMKLSLNDVKDAETPYEISLGILDSDSAHGCLVEMYCQTTLYSSHACRTVLDAYLRLVETFVADSNKHIDECKLFNEDDVSRALQLGLGPEISAASLGWPTTLSQRVLDTCRLHLADPAIKDETVTVSYSQLRARIKAVAEAMLDTASSTGTEKDPCLIGSYVAVLCKPSVDAIVAMLAILQVGAVFVPLDTSLPMARHTAIINSCEPRLVLFHAATEERVSDLALNLNLNFNLNLNLNQVRVDDVSKEVELAIEEAGRARGHFLDTIRDLDPEAPAILYFTSGSTGKPKGILLSQANFVNYLVGMTHVFGLDAHEYVLQQSSLGFDMSLMQVFYALANGGCLVIVPAESRRDPVELTKLVSNCRVTLTFATPSEYVAWLRYGSASLRENTAWRHAFVGGEPFSQQLRDDMCRLGLDDLRLINCYGPTESTAHATFQPINLPIGKGNRGNGQANERKDENEKTLRYAVGKALPNYSVRIIDAFGSSLPVLHNGEICIGGLGVAMGYLGQGLANETRRKFIMDPQSGQQLYRTGDQGRLLTDGTLLCLGRMDADTMVKLRGLRVDLQEVESALLQSADGLFATAAVSCRGDMLVAHVTLAVSSLDRDKPLEVGEAKLTQILACLNLPQYFVPAAIIILPTMPTNANGKLDRKAISALPLPRKHDSVNSSSGFEPDPQEQMTLCEAEVRLLWEGVLPETALATTARISPSSDFFMCGGNSLLLMKLQAAINESLGLSVSTRVLYQTSRLRDMAQYVDKKREEQANDSKLSGAVLSQDGKIDWTAETAVPDWLQRQISLLSRDSSLNDTKTLSFAKAEDGIEVLLTGATSFLGGRLLRALVLSPRVRKVYCIAVPPDDEHLLYQDDKVERFSGSLLTSARDLEESSKSMLGLSKAEQERLEQTIDVIIHAGSSGHCLNTYASLRTPNLLSTQLLASLALQRSIPFLFVSSSRVVLFSGDMAPPPGSVARFPPPADGVEGFPSSKWASEVFLENLVAFLNKESRAATPWTVAVHRPCVLIGKQAPNSDALNAILRYSRSMRCVPQLSNIARGYLDFAEADTVANEIAETVPRLASRPSAPAAGTSPANASLVAEQEGHQADSSAVIQFRHHSGGIKVPISEFRTQLENIFGGRFDEVDIARWVRSARKAGLDPLITAYLEGVLETGKLLVFPYLCEGSKTK